ncbi:hypothetical protein BGZ81_008271 [Podila clonocystis]|nr:hypothetical protein BGZ81_008271 [Podila clonocystis]
MGWHHQDCLVLSHFLPASSVVCQVLFLFSKYFVLKHHDSFRRDLIAIPVYIGVALTHPVGVGLANFLWCFFFLRPCLHRKIQNDEDLKRYRVFYVPMVTQCVKLALHQEGIAEKDGARGHIEEDKSFAQRRKAKFLGGHNQDINETQDEATLAAHEHATKFDPQTERLFSAVRVVTVSFTSFSYGSNNMINAIGPLPLSTTSGIPLLFGISVREMK